MASIEKVKGSNGSGNANVATVQTLRTAGSSSILVDTVLNINPAGFSASMGTPHTFTDPVTSEVITVISEASAVDFTGHINSGHIEIDTIAPGYTDAGSKVGDIVVIRPTNQWADNLASVLAAAHNDDGTPSPAGIHFAMPAGAVIPYAGAAAPTGFLLCDGSSLLRTSYAGLFSAIGTVFGSVDGTHFTIPDMRSRIPVGVGTGTLLATFASRASNVITVTGIDNTSQNGFQTGEPVLYHSATTVMTGLTNDTTYYLIRTGNLTFSLAATLPDAVAGNVIALSSDGSGAQTFTLSHAVRALANRGGEDTHASTITETPAHTHIKASQFGNDGGSFADAAFWSKVGGAGGGDPGSTGTTGGSAAHNNMPPFLALNYIIKT